MKLKKLLLGMILLIGSSISTAQSIVEHVQIQSSSVDLTNETILGQTTINPTVDGRVIVRFDGYLTADVGDRIVLAASNDGSWHTNDGSVGIEIIDADVNRKSFSHTRVYDVTAGANTFYAVGHNYVETDGSGIASIYGSLTVEFIPTGADYFVESLAIAPGFVDFNTLTTLGQIDINPIVPGKVIVSFDGKCSADVGDRIILAASNSTSWMANDGNVSVEAFDADVNGASFSHTRVYDVTAGSHSFYAVGQNYVETDGSGIAAVYGTLVVEFIPTTSIVSVQHTGVSTIQSDLTTVTELAQLTINPTVAGKAIVKFNGMASADVGDRIILAASDHVGWGVNDGHVSIESPNTDQNINNFSHTQVYDVTAGSHTFYAVAQNYVETAGGNGSSIYGSFTVIFVPSGLTGIEESVTDGIFVYPNPAKSSIQISGLKSSDRITIISINGDQIYSSSADGNSVKIDVSTLQSGVYFIKIINESGVKVQKLIKE